MPAPREVIRPPGMVGKVAPVPSVRLPPLLATLRLGDRPGPMTWPGSRRRPGD